jgi:DNA polymerase-3 subunit epsilon
MIKIFYDLETTGLDVKKHSIHQIAGYIEKDGEVVEKFDIKTRPHPKAKYEAAALVVCGKTEAELKQYPRMGQAHKALCAILDKYVKKMDKTDKAFLIGFNNRYFDDGFLTAWFEQCKNNFWASYFWMGVDVQALALHYLQDRRAAMPSFKLKRVAMELGLEVDKEKLHDAFYDVELTYQIYRVVTGIEEEI